MVRSKKVLSAHFRPKPYPPVADLNSTLSAQRNTGSASNKNYRRPEKVASAAEASGGRLQPSSRSKRDFSRRSRRKGAGGWSPYRGPEHSGLCVCEGGSGIPVLARRRYLYFLPWVGARVCRPRVSGGKKWTTGWSRPLGPFFRAYRAGQQKQPFFFPYKTEITSAREKLLAQRRRREGVYYPKGHRQPSSRSKRDFSRRSRHKGAGG